MGQKKMRQALRLGGGAAATAPHKPYQATVTSYKKRQGEAQRLLYSSTLGSSTTRLQVRPQFAKTYLTTAGPSLCTCSATL